MHGKAGKFVLALDARNARSRDRLGTVINGVKALCRGRAHTLAPIAARTADWNITSPGVGPRRMLAGSRVQ